MSSVHEHILTSMKNKTMHFFFFLVFCPLLNNLCHTYTVNSSETEVWQNLPLIERVRESKLNGRWKCL